MSESESEDEPGEITPEKKERLEKEKKIREEEERVRQRKVREKEEFIERLKQEQQDFLKIQDELIQKSILEMIEVTIFFSLVVFIHWDEDIGIFGVVPCTGKYFFVHASA